MLEQKRCSSGRVESHLLCTGPMKNDLVCAQESCYRRRLSWPAIRVCNNKLVFILYASALNLCLHMHSTIRFLKNLIRLLISDICKKLFKICHIIIKQKLIWMYCPPFHFTFESSLHNFFSFFLLITVLYSSYWILTLWIWLHRGNYGGKNTGSGLGKQPDDVMCGV